jgi:hypothetical protein
VCEKLNEKQVEYIDLQTWGYVNNGFKGSAIISAVFWEHDVFSGSGLFIRNLLGLGAVSIERSKTRLGEDIAGDEAAGSRGIPFKQSDVEDEEFEFGFMPEGRIPECPGVPTNNPPPGEEVCLEPPDGTWHAEPGTETAPVPLFFTPGVCTGQGATPQTYGHENPDYEWDGVGGQILTYVNCSSGDEDVTFYTYRASCSGAAPYGLLIAFYQAPDGSSNPFNPGAVCTNNIFPQNPTVLGFCEDGPCTYTVGPGEYQVLVQTNLIGGQCATGFDYDISH